MCPSTGQFSMRGSSSAQPVPIRSFCPCALLPVEAFEPSAAGLSRDKFVDLWRSFDGIDRIRAVPGQEQHFRLAKEYWTHFDGMGNGPKPQFPVPSMQLPPPRKMGLDAGDGKLDKTEFGIMHADLCRSGFHLESLQAASLLTRLRCGRKLLVYSFRTYLLSKAAAIEACGRRQHVRGRCCRTRSPC